LEHWAPIGFIAVVNDLRLHIGWNSESEPSVLIKVLQLSPPLSRFYCRLQCTVARCVWAEHTAVTEGLAELLAGVKRSVQLGQDLP
jgi:hypothetical protein